MIADRRRVLVLTLAAVGLLTVATVTGNAIVGWASLGLFVAEVAAYVRWRRNRRRMF